MSYSDDHAEHLDCTHRREGRFHHGERPREHGTRFVTAFHFKGSGNHLPVTKPAWVREGGKEWRIIASDFESH